ncbi:efflux RND transporter periplasmic adaptor subunit [Pseudorhodoferax sp. Leaf267]|uniref:efflux RND transporter periplasmic adaptor subunit n=1 Tax=Pseudorhodoferax sp. Leaf267 TaxID=1736316 RepID=UPI0009EC29B0|nr:efflux RND transporter periplasmic adaptor subunit [Pseudorhodoferax sp. Leaf267]
MPTRTKPLWPRVAGITFALAALCAGGYFAWKTWFQTENPRNQYQIVSVQRGDIEDLVTATGTLQPLDYVDVGAQVSGQLKKIHVEVGSLVQQGDLLAEIDPTVLLANVDASRAGLRNLQATLLVREAALVLARDQYQRQKNLMAEDATTTEALRTAENNLRSAEAQLAAQKASIEQTQSTLRASEANLNYARIYAPISGAVVSVTARQGQTLNVNQSAPTLLRVANLATMTVQTQVSEADVSKLRPGMPAYFTTLGSQGQRYYGKLRKVEPTPTVTNNVVLYNALFDVPNTNQSLMTSMTAQVFFIAAQAQGTLLVPAAAVQVAPRGPRRPGGPAGAPGAGASSPPGGASAPAVAASASQPATGVGGPPAQNADGSPLTEEQRQARERRRAEVAAMGEDDRRALFEQRRREREASAPASAAAPAKPEEAATERAAAARTPGQAAAAVNRGLFTGPSGPAQRGARRATVRVIDAQGQVEERQVEIGISNRVQVQVLSGLQEGEEVIAGNKLPAGPASGARGSQAKGPGLPTGGMPPGGPR